MNGVEAIAAERRRQIESEGWSDEHDDQHTDESLALVAAVFASPVQLYDFETTHIDQKPIECRFIDPWPASWDDAWDKRNDVDRRQLLVMAGALIAAEIDRLDRLPVPQKP